MNLFRKLLGIFEPQPTQRFIPTAQWTGIFASMIVANIARFGMAELKQMAAFISKSDNGPRLTRMPDSSLPNMTNDPDVLVYCYLKDVSMFAKNAAAIERLIELSVTQAQILAEATGDKTLLTQFDDSVLQFPGIDQIAFNLASELERKVAQLKGRSA